MGGKNNYFKVFVYEITTKNLEIGNGLRHSALLNSEENSW